MTVALLHVYIPLCTAFASFLTKMRVPLVCTFTPSIKLKVPVVVKLAPTPLLPLLYVIVPLVIIANVSGVAAAAASCTFNP